MPAARRFKAYVRFWLKADIRLMAPMQECPARGFLGTRLFLFSGFLAHDRATAQEPVLFIGK